MTTHHLRRHSTRPTCAYEIERHAKSSKRRQYTLSVFNASSTCRSMSELLQLHAHAIKLGLEEDVSVTSQLLSFCAVSDAGSLDYATLLFNHLLLHYLDHINSFVWNTMIRGHARSADPVAAIHLFDEMLTRGLVPPDKFTFPFALKACARLQVLFQGQQLHSHIVKSGTASDPVVQNALMHMYAQSGSVAAARRIFDRNPQRDSVSWNSLIGGYVRDGQLEEAGRLFSLMPQEKKTPFSWSIMLSGYARLGCPELAKSFLRQLPAEFAPRDSPISLTCLISLYMEAGEVEAARRVFDSMNFKDVVCWSSLISGYVHNGHYMEALKLFNEMQTAAEGMKPDKVLLVSVISACAHVGALKQGKWLHAYIQKKFPSAAGRPEGELSCALIDMYSKCGSIKDALEVFHMVIAKDLMVWNAIIGGLGVNGHGKAAVSYFQEMLGSGIMPDRVTFVSVLGACAHSGLLDEGRKHFQLMARSYGVEPDIKHYGCMIDLLGRAGLVHEAEALVETMPMTPNVEIWGALLGACRKHGDVAVAERAARKLMELDPEHSAGLVLLSNVYAAAGHWSNVRSARQEMRSKRIKRVPGCSMIESKGSVYEFVAGDVSHPRAGEIYSKLQQVIEQLKLSDHALETSVALFDGGEEEKEAALTYHSEKLALALGLIDSCPEDTIRIVKNLRVCADCHSTMKLVSHVYRREIILRDRNRFHHFKEGLCSCMDYW
ncbi:hypothetical protein ACLOJK_001682 [Asimina triloba]